MLLNWQNPWSHSTQNMRVARRTELTYNCLETGVKLCQERRLILQRQHSFFHHGTFNIIVLNHHVFFQYFDRIELLCPFPVCQHHLHKQKPETYLPEGLYSWQSSFPFYWYRLTRPKPRKYHCHPPVAMSCTSSFTQSLCQNPLVNRRHVAKRPRKC